MALDTTICCCGASTWTKVIAWIHIVANLFYFFAFLKDFAKDNTKMLLLAIPITFLLLGIIMGVILLIGTMQKRVGYLISWLIYGSAALTVSISYIIINLGRGGIIEFVVGLMGIAINMCFLVVVSIHTKDIQPVPSTLASIWTTVIAWILIAFHTINLIVTMFVIAPAFWVTSEHQSSNDISPVIAFAVISIVCSCLGIAMAIFLIKGTNQKRVSYLKAWLIYGGVAVVVSVIQIIFAYISVNVVLEIALDIFAFVVVCVFMKEIIGGVFDLQPKQPVTMPEP